MNDLNYLRTEYARNKMIEEYNKPYPAKEIDSAGHIQRNDVQGESDVQRSDRDQPADK